MTKYLNVLISEELRRDFKATAIQKGLSIPEALEEAFRLWIDKVRKGEKSNE